MAYLSRIDLNPLRRGAQNLILNPQAMHAAVLGGLPPGVNGRVLWREDRSASTGGAPRSSVIVLTPEEPDWSHLVEQAGWGTAQGAPLIRDLQPLLDLVVTGRRFGFRLRANPTESTKTPATPTAIQRGRQDRGERRGVRVAHRTAGHQLDWFLKRTTTNEAAWGFTVQQEPLPEVQLVERDVLRFRKGRDVSHNVTLARATFEGVLTVTDSQRLRGLLLAGIGRGKAYGCGLLTLAPEKADVVVG
ncbi:MAG: type I-E CRISPR-associated protein Cas6/Cse3/CasE [Nostocoides sp.]